MNEGMTMISVCPVVALPSPGLRPARSSPAYPADEARSQFTEILEVKGTNARVELPSQEKVVDEIA